MRYKDVPKMGKRVKNKWLKALRSGEYIQGQSQLVTDPHDPKEDYKFCCLGVLQDLYHLEKNEDFPIDRQGDGYHNEKCAMWAGISNDDVSFEETIIGVPVNNRYYRTIVDMSVHEYLAHLNDEGKSFKQIARWVENHL